MHVQIIMEPYDFNTVIIRDQSNNVIDELPVPKEVDIDKFLENRLKEMSNSCRALAENV